MKYNWIQKLTKPLKCVFAPVYVCAMYVRTDADLQDYYIKTDKSSSVTVNLLSMPDRLCLQRKPV